jgi:RNA polymerase sigma factor (sigma-70 family)
MEEMVVLQHSSDTQTDQMLWILLRKGDVSAFTTLFERHHKTLYNYGYKLTADVNRTEDAVQEVFINVWKLRASLTEEINSVKFYLFRALRRTIHRSLAQDLMHHRLVELDEWDIRGFNEDIQSQWIEAETINQQSQNMLQLLHELPDRQLEALTLRYFDAFKISEIAEIMGVSEKSVRNFIYKGLSSLRENREFIFRALFPFLLYL